MTDAEPPHDEAADAASGVPPWCTATLDDAGAVDFEGPIRDVHTADCAVLRDKYEAAVTALVGDDGAQKQARVFGMLAGLTSMYAKSDSPHDPFGPMLQMGDRRTAIPSDFETCLEVVADLAERATHPVLRARLCDVAWLLDRTRGALGIAAVTAYVDIVEHTERGELAHRVAPEVGALQSASAAALRRALQVGRLVGWDKPSVVRAKAAVARLRTEAINTKHYPAVRRFCALDLDYGISAPEELGLDLTAMLTMEVDPAHALDAVELWQLAARAYTRAHDDANTHRAKAAAAECLVTHALAQNGSSMLKAHFLSDAIAALHGVPEQRTRRSELLELLIDVQARITDELTPFATTLDIQGLVEDAERRMRDIDLFDMLFAVAAIDHSPDLSKIEEQARAAIREHPLLAMFAPAQHDRHGKVLSRTDATRIGGDPTDSAVQHQIEQTERIRRQVVVDGSINPALRIVRDRYHLSDAAFQLVLRHSPAVPPDLLATMARGFRCFFVGDGVSATYILTPLLEAILRYILQNAGHDVTVFDDATQTQKDRSISQLFDQMRHALDDILGVDMTADFERVFLRQPGPTLRHAVAHGLLHDGDPYGSETAYGCWLVYRLCLIPLFEHTSEVRDWIGGSL